VENQQENNKIQNQDQEKMKTVGGGFQSTLNDYKEEETIEEEKKEPEKGEIPEIELNKFLALIAGFASKGLPENLRKKFVRDYIDINYPILEFIDYQRSIAWFLEYVAVMPDWLRFVVGTGCLVGTGLYLRVSIQAEFKKMQKQKQKEEKSEESQE